MNDNEDNDSESSQNQISLKILIIGDTLVGKTSILLKYVDHIFPEEHIATIGVEYKDKYIIKDNYNIRLQIWDTAGQERFHSITKNIFRGTRMNRSSSYSGTFWTTVPIFQPVWFNHPFVPALFAST